MVRSDFDGQVRQHLHAIHSVGGLEGVQTAMQVVHKIVIGKSRADVRRWPAYMVTILKKVHEELKAGPRQSRMEFAGNHTSSNTESSTSARFGHIGTETIATSRPSSTLEAIHRCTQTGGDFLAVAGSTASVLHTTARHALEEFERSPPSGGDAFGDANTRGPLVHRPSQETHTAQIPGTGRSSPALHIQTTALPMPAVQLAASVSFAAAQLTDWQQQRVVNHEVAGQASLHVSQDARSPSFDFSHGRIPRKPPPGNKLGNWMMVDFDSTNYPANWKSSGGWRSPRISWWEDHVATSVLPTRQSPKERSPVLCDRSPIQACSGVGVQAASSIGRELGLDSGDFRAALSSCAPAFHPGGWHCVWQGPCEIGAADADRRALQALWKQSGCGTELFGHLKLLSAPASAARPFYWYADGHR